MTEAVPEPGDQAYDCLPADRRQALAREVQWARRESDAQAALANERARDLMERLRRLSQALQQRGDDFLASAVDNHGLRVQELVELLEVLEGRLHRTTRQDEGRVPRPREIS